MDPPIIQQRRRTFMNVCESISMPFEKASLLCNCFINRVTIGSVYHQNIEESVNGILKLVKLHGHDMDILSQIYHDGCG